VSNHTFVDRPKEKAHQRIRCPNCGVWASATSGQCYACGFEINVRGRYQTSRGAHQLLARQPGFGSGAGPAVTVHQHQFRDRSPEAKHNKVRCMNCGVWAARGGICYNCGTQQPKGARPSTLAFEQIQRAPGYGDEGGRDDRPHEFRSLKVDKVEHRRVRCPSCGVWARKGEPCYQCGYMAPEEPSKQAIQRAPGFGSDTYDDRPHQFRTPTPDKEHRKIRCYNCGVWARPGSDCYNCGAPQPHMVRARNRRAHEQIARAPGFGTAPPGAQEEPRKRYGSLQHGFREILSDVSPSRHQKVKCRQCGCWGHKGGDCYFCGARMPADAGDPVQARLSRTRPSSAPRVRPSSAPRVRRASKSQERAMIGLSSLNASPARFGRSMTPDGATRSSMLRRQHALNRREPFQRMPGSETHIVMVPPRPLDDVSFIEGPY